jgi:ABC-type Fe3+/spermidine/putrescine transport system ATPase subunit
MAIADRIALMQAGELLQVGAPLEIYHKPNCADVAEFFGSVNWLDAQVVESGVADSAIGKLNIASSSKIGDKVLLGFRPECLSLSEPGAKADGNCFRAKIGSSTFLGDQFVYTAVIKDQHLFGKSRTIPESSDGTTLCHVSPADIMVFPCRV